MTLSFDRRITPARPDLAAAHLVGQVESARFVEGVRRAVAVTCVPLRPEPHPDQGIDTELLFGEIFTVYDEDAEGWAWGQAERDGYVGWLPTAALEMDAPEPITHRVAALRTFVFPEPSIKRPVAMVLPFSASLAATRPEGEFVATRLGFVWAGHLCDAAFREPDAVAVAERFVGTPYLWGGRSSLGLDCSGLVQAALEAAGIQAPRDSDMQERGLGLAIDPEAGLRRGDLVFWKGHVGLMQDADTLLHANGHTMSVHSEPFRPARARILAATGADVTSVKRL